MMSSKVGAESKSGGGGGQRSSRGHPGGAGNGENNQRQIQTLLRNEGRSARNLVSWNVPFDPEEKEQNQNELVNGANNNSSQNDDSGEFSK